MRTVGYMLVGIALLALGGDRLLSADAQASDSKLNARRLKTGRFLLRELLNGKEVGNGELSIRELPNSGNFVYTNGETGQFAQQWEAIATPAFVPVSAKLAFGEGDKMRPAFELKYQDGRVTGFALQKHGSEAPSKVTVNAEVPPDTVDQRIDWAAVMSQDLVPGREFEFHVFDPGTGITHVRGRVTGPETVHVPAGTFAAMRVVYRMEKSSGTEVFQLLTQREGPRMLLKEEFPDGSVSELVEVKNE